MNQHYLRYTLDLRKNKDSIPTWRSKAILLLFTLTCLGMLGRAFWLQVLHKDFYLEKGDTRLLRMQPLLAARGRVLDRNGMLLASSVPAIDIWAYPEYLSRDSNYQLTPEIQVKIKELAQVLDIPLDELQQLLAKLNPSYVALHRRAPPELKGKIANFQILRGIDKKQLKNSNASLQPKLQNKLNELAHTLDMPIDELRQHLVNLAPTYVALKRRVSPALWQEIANLGIKGIYFDPLYRREYPEGEDTAHLLGYVDLDWQGMEGVERTFDNILAGRNGLHRYFVDSRKRAVDTVERTPPVDGKDVTLSLDVRLQSFAAKALCNQVALHKAQAGSLIALDARTGEILALTNCPSYNPYWTTDSFTTRKKFNRDVLRNRAVSDVFEPGSVMKPFTVAMALELGRVRSDTVVDTAPGYIYLEGRKEPVRDTRNFGALTVEGVIQKSSNVGAIKISHKLTAQEMWNTYSALGYGQVPKIEYPRPLSGILHHWEKLKPAEKDSQSYGYGLSATLLQLARSYTVFANDGRLLPLTLLKADAVPEGNQVFSPHTTAQVRHMLGLATGPGGTGQKAQIEGYAVGGKSGTARKHGGKDVGYIKGHYRSWFVGLAPLEKPRVIIAVLIDEPKAGQIYGGAVAAPVFSKVAQRALRLLDLPPNLAIQPQFSTIPLPEPVESEP